MNNPNPRLIDQIVSITAQSGQIAKDLSETILANPDMIRINRVDDINIALHKKLHYGRMLPIIGKSQPLPTRDVMPEEEYHIPVPMTIGTVYRASYPDIQTKYRKYINLEGGETLIKKDQGDNLASKLQNDADEQARQDISQSMKAITAGAFNGSSTFRDANGNPYEITTGITNRPIVTTSWANSAADIINDMEGNVAAMEAVNGDLYRTIVSDSTLRRMKDNNSISDYAKGWAGNNTGIRDIFAEGEIFGRGGLVSTRAAYRDYLGTTNEIIDNQFAYYIPEQPDGRPLIEIWVAPSKKDPRYLTDANSGFGLLESSNIPGFEAVQNYEKAIRANDELYYELAVLSDVAFTINVNPQTIMRQQVILP